MQCLLNLVLRQRLLEHHDQLRIRDGQVSTTRELIERLVLSISERKIFTILQAHGGVMPWRDLRALYPQCGLSPTSKRSPILLRTKGRTKGTRIWAHLPGHEPLSGAYPKTRVESSGLVGDTISIELDYEPDATVTFRVPVRLQPYLEGKTFIICNGSTQAKVTFKTRVPREQNAFIPRALASYANYTQRLKLTLDVRRMRGTAKISPVGIPLFDEVNATVIQDVASTKFNANERIQTRLLYVASKLPLGKNCFGRIVAGLPYVTNNKVYIPTRCVCGKEEWLLARKMIVLSLQQPSPTCHCQNAKRDRNPVKGKKTRRRLFVERITKEFPVGLKVRDRVVSGKPVWKNQSLRVPCRCLRCKTTRYFILDTLRHRTERCHCVVRTEKVAKMYEAQVRARRLKLKTNASIKGFLILKAPTCLDYNEKVQCRCQCGTEVYVRVATLMKQNLKPGCITCKRSKHGGNGTLLYARWQQMKANQKPVCLEWIHFEGFRDWAERNGFESRRSNRAKNAIIRKNLSQPYSPENCFWGTTIQLRVKTRPDPLLTINGVIKPRSQWLREAGISSQLFWTRMRRGLSAEDALATPKLRHRERRWGKLVARKFRPDSFSKPTAQSG